MTEEILSPEQQRLIGELFQNLPADFPARYAAVTQIRDVFHQQLGKTLQDSLIAHLVKQPQTTVAERRELTYQLNGVLRSLGLAIKCPRTGLPANLVVDQPDSKRDKSRFRLDIKTGDGSNKRTLTEHVLPLPLEFVPCAARTEPLSKAKLPEGLQR